MIDKAHAEWTLEYNGLKKELDRVGGPPKEKGKSDPVQRALGLQMKRLEGEYLRFTGGHGTDRRSATRTVLRATAPAARAFRSDA